MIPSNAAAAATASATAAAAVTTTAAAVAAAAVAAAADAAAVAAAAAAAAAVGDHLKSKYYTWIFQITTKDRLGTFLLMILLYIHTSLIRFRLAKGMYDAI